MAAWQHRSQEVENVCKGDFEWKIDDFLELGGRTDSPEFYISGNEWNLYINELDRDDFFNEDVYHVGLYNRTFYSTNLCRKVFFELSVINRFGQCFLSTCGTIRPDDDVDDTILMVLCGSSLKCHSYEVLPGDTLTLRLSWTKQDPHEEDTPETPYHVPETLQTELLKKLSDDFSHFYSSKTDTDCMLRVGDVELPVHRGVLSARSTVFADMFNHDTSENRCNVVDVPDVDAAIMSDILNYVYSGQIRGLTSDTAVPMYIVAEKYALMDMKDICLDVFRSSLTIENICDSAILAYTHEKTELTNQVVRFVEERMGELEESENWKRFLKFKPSLAIKLLLSVIARKDSKKLSSDN